MSDIEAETDVFEALETFEDTIEQLETVDSVATRMKAEADALDQLADAVGEGLASGADIQVGPIAATVADITNSLTKTDAKQEIQNRVEEKKADANDRARLDEWLTDNLREVRIVQTTDHLDDTRFVWDFDGSQVETTGGADGRGHYNWVNFRDLIDEGGGPYLAGPNDGIRDAPEWREWIVDLREERKNTKTVKGPRTSAVEYLQNRVRRSDAFGEMAAALNFGGVYAEVNNDPPDGKQPVDTDAEPQECPEWRVEMLLVPNEWPIEAAEEYGISTRALQNEIDARGHMLNGETQISTQEYVAGQYVTFWALDGGFAAPSAYQPDGATERTGPAALEGTEQDSEPTDDRDFGEIGGSDND